MSTGLSFAPSENQQAVAASVARFCTANDAESAARNTEGDFPRELWRALAGLGVFTPTAPGYEDAGGALELCAICTALGEHAFPGPIAATYVAVQVLPEHEREQVMAGEAIVSLASSGDSLLPYGTLADIFLVTAHDRLHRAEPATAPDAVPSNVDRTFALKSNIDLFAMMAPL